MKYFAPTIHGNCNCEVGRICSHVDIFKLTVIYNGENSVQVSDQNPRCSSQTMDSTGGLEHSSKRQVFLPENSHRCSTGLRCGDCKGNNFSSVTPLPCGCGYCPFIILRHQDINVSSQHKGENLEQLCVDLL